MKRVLVLLFFTLLFIAGCKYSDKQSTLILSKFPNGNPMAIVQRINDSAFIYLSYFENGSIYDSIPYVKGKISGIARECHYNKTNGLIIVYTQYINSRPDGIQYAYYYQNRTKRWVGKVSGYDPIDEWKYYYENGNLSAYIYHSDKGKYFRKYSKDGVFLQEDGYVLVGMEGNKTSYSINDTIDTKLLVATPPDLKIEIKIGDLSKNKVIVNPISKEIINNKVEIKKLAPKEPGDYFITIEVSINNNKTNERKTYNSYFEVFVRN